MPIGEPKCLTDARRYFREPDTARQRKYEALRAYFLEEAPSHEVARRFGYTPGAFRVLCHDFRRDALPPFFASPQPGPRTQPKKARAREQIIALRKRNYSVYDISQALREQGLDLSTTAVREVLREQGFAPLPRRLDEERPAASRVPPSSPWPMCAALRSPRNASPRASGDCFCSYPTWSVCDSTDSPSRLACRARA